MSTQELVPLFPSATHPALPISAQILSTLRHLTAPGKGNDLKAEERAALVGVAALLGCEKIQSKDLPFSSAQKASSVSPAHFRSSLSRCRKLLESTTLPTTSSPTKSDKGKGRGTRQASSSLSPSKRPAVVVAVTAKTTSTSTSVSAPGSGSGFGTEIEGEANDDVTPTPNPPLISASPFTTPRKKFKFSSGIDISSLVRSPRQAQAHDPTVASPLRHSVTRQPSTRIDKNAQTRTSSAGQSEDDEEVGREGESELGTPTKKVKYSNPVGIDLEHPPPLSSTHLSSSAARRKREREDPSAFFAMRPGMGSLSTPAGKGTGTGTKDLHHAGEEGEGWLRRLRTEERSAPRSRKDRREKRVDKKIQKRDWTFAEGVWGTAETQRQNTAILGRVWEHLPVWLEKNGQPTVEETEVGEGGTLVDILLRAGEERGI
ncbi:hypothetical protein IAR55_002913 [Kwoniella newhampshirensis]|uniref:Uncharacterized protein n=1 Tax=Kwoniella newhampshirensis TaxID=1651941 RepID=A0AAW0YNY5_9TREE